MTLRSVKATDVGCPRKKCGALYDTSSRLAVALGVKQLTCDRCQSTWSVRVVPVDPHGPPPEQGAPQ